MLSLEPGQETESQSVLYKVRNIKLSLALPVSPALQCTGGDWEDASTTRTSAVCCDSDVCSLTNVHIHLHGQHRDQQDPRHLTARQAVE